MDFLIRTALLFLEKLGELREVGTGGEFASEGAHRGDWVGCASGAH